MDSLGHGSGRVGLESERLRLSPGPGRNTLHPELSCIGGDAIGEDVKPAKSDFSGLQVSESDPGGPNRLDADRKAFTPTNNGKNLAQSEYSGTDKKLLLSRIDHGNLNSIDEFTEGCLANLLGDMTDHRSPPWILIEAKWPTLTADNGESLFHACDPVIQILSKEPRGDAPRPARGGDRNGFLGSQQGDSEEESKESRLHYFCHVV